MKVACIGNMNNNFFSLVRYLRDNKIDANLLLLNNDNNFFHPSTDTFYDDYKNYTVQLDWGAIKKFDYLLTSKHKIAKDLKPYDFIIACGTALAFIEKGGRKTDIFVPYGSDIFYLPFVRLSFISKNSLADFIKTPFFMSQKRGIKNAHLINCDDRDTQFRFYLEKLKVLDKTIHFSTPMLYNKDYSPTNIKKSYSKSKWYEKFLEIRNTYDMIVFYHNRHWWKKDIGDRGINKGTDIFMRGFTKFVKENEFINVCIVTFENGQDLEESKKLVVDLGIEKNVKWFPALPRKELMVGLSLADIAIGHFRAGRYGGGTVAESLAMGKPLLHYVRKELYEGRALYPFINVKTSDEICAAMEDYVQEPEKYKQIGRKAKEWYDENRVKKCIDIFVEKINQNSIQ